MTSFHYFWVGLFDYILAVMQGIEPGPGVPEGPEPLKKAANSWILATGATLTVLLLGAVLLGFVAPTVAQSPLAPSTYTMASGSILFAIGILGYLMFALGKGFFRLYRTMRQRGMEIVSGQRPSQWSLVKERIKALLYRE